MRTRAGMATMPGRELALELAVASIIEQVDELHVQVNGMAQLPAFLDHHRITCHVGPDLADTGKFAFADGFDGVYLALDDDILYPAGYAQQLCDRLAQNPTTVFGWHGSIVRPGLADYYARESREVLQYFGVVPADTRVDILGTGTLAMVPVAVDFDFAATFSHRLVSDIEFAIAMRARAVPLVVIAHEADRMLPVAAENRGPSISGSSRGAPGGALDVRQLATGLVREHALWQQTPLTGDEPARRNLLDWEEHS